MAGEGDNHRVVGAAGDNYRIGRIANAFKVALLDFLTGLDLNAALLDAVDFARKYLARQTFAGDGLTQLAADFLIAFIDGDAMAA